MSAPKGRSIWARSSAPSRALYLPIGIPAAASPHVRAPRHERAARSGPLIAGWLKAYRGINEVIVTLLLNYVGINIVSYAAGGPMMEEGAPYPYSRRDPRHAASCRIIMPPTDAHVGAIVGIVLAIGLGAGARIHDASASP